MGRVGELDVVAQRKICICKTAIATRVSEEQKKRREIERGGINWPLMRMYPTNLLHYHMTPKAWTSRQNEASKS